MRAILGTCAVVLAVVAVILGIAHYGLRPAEFRIAIPANDTLDQRVFGTAADMLRTQRSTVRIEVVTVDNAKAALDQLEAGKVKLAVVRSDTAMQGRAQTVLIMRREAAILVAAKGGKLKKVTDLPNAMIGFTRDGTLDGSLLWPVLDYYGIQRDKTKHVEVAPDEVANAIRQKKVDAIIVVGSVVSKQVGDTVGEAARGAKGAIDFIDIEEADAIAKRIPALEAIEVEQGAFGGRPPRPAESFNTLGFTIRLVGTQKIAADDMAEFMKQLYLIRQNISAAVPGAGLMEAPDVDEATPYLIHPGVRAYVNGDQKTLFDRYSDWIYFGAFIMSGLGSVAVGLFGWLGGKREGNPQAPLRRLQDLLAAAREAPDMATLDQVERDADETFQVAYAHGINDELSASALASFNLGLSELRRCIAARRTVLAS